MAIPQGPQNVFSRAISKYSCFNETYTELTFRISKIIIEWFKWHFCES